MRQWMAGHGLGSDYSKLEGYFAGRVLDYTQALGKSAIVWQDALDNGAPLRSDVVVQVWKWWAGPSWRSGGSLLGLLGQWWGRQGRPCSLARGCGSPTEHSEDVWMAEVARTTQKVRSPPPYQRSQLSCA